jgi:hypothetical protein
LPAFYIDNDVSRAVAPLLREAGHDAVSAENLRLDRAGDEEHVLVAAEQRRVFITHNERDFLLLHDAWRRWTTAWHMSQQHAGIVVVPQGRRYGVDWSAQQIASAAADLVRRAGAEMPNQLLRRRDPS